MKDIGIIGSADGPTSIFVSSKDENFFQSGGIIEEDVNIEENLEESSIENNIEEIKVESSIDDILNSRTLGENFESGFKIMGLGMIAVFGVLTVLYIVIKIMGQFAKNNKDKDSSNEKN